MTGRAYRHSAEVAAGIGTYDEYGKNREPHNRVMRMHRDAADLLGRVARWPDDDLLGEEDDIDHVLEGGGVEAAVLAAELHQVDRREVAGRVVDVHVLGARIRSVDPPRLRAGVPAVYRGVVLDAVIRAAPGRVGDLAHQLACGNRLQRLAARPRGELPIIAALHGIHELVGHP